MKIKCGYEEMMILKDKITHEQVELIMDDLEQLENLGT
jgi:hypothetical protein